MRAPRRLDDPHIARFIDSFALDDVGLCLVLEPVDGEPLADWCAQHQPRVDARLGLYLQICQAGASAHQQLVVHRDLKPDNVLVDAAGNIKLLDFGVAKLLEDENSQTQTHGGLYTLEFAAPEQVLRNPVSTATDVYALGVLLFRLLTGASPYVVGANESLVKAVLSDRPRTLAQARTPTDQGKIGPALDRDLDRVIGRAMEKDPRDRYRSVMELVADVQAIRAGMPIRAGGGRGDPLAALQTYQSIIELRTSLDGDNRADAAMDYSNLGAALMFLSRFDEAAAAYTQGIALLRARLGDQHPRLGVIRSGHANVLIQLGRLDEARAELLAAGQVMAGGGDPADRNRYQTVAEQNLAAVDYWAGDYPAASARLGAIEPHIPATHRSSFLLWRGRVALAQKRYTEAAADFQSAQALYVDSGGAAHPRRWLAQGLAILAVGETHPAQMDRKALQGALDALATPPSSLTAERAELLLQAGASARRHGEYPRAIELHKLCAQIIGKNHWLGALGSAMIETELRLDGAVLDPAGAHAASR